MASVPRTTYIVVRPFSSVGSLAYGDVAKF